MLKIVHFLVLVAVATNALPARIARSPGGAGWQSSSSYDPSSSVIAAARSSGWSSGTFGKNSASNGWGDSSSGYGRNSGTSNGWAGLSSSYGRSSGGSNGWGGSSSDYGRSSGSWQDSNGWAGASNGYGSGSNGYSSGSDGHGGLTGSIDFRSNGNGWHASW